MKPIRIGLVGLGKIARDQHIPTIASSPAFELAACVSRGNAQPGVPVFSDVGQMLRSAALDAVAIATPPAPRHGIARACIDAGVDVLLEKPPCSTLGEAQDLARRAGQAGQVLFAAWHSQFNEAVERAAAITRSEGLASLVIEWLEDAGKWHPGQQWPWEPGGFGVFDAGMNALSIVSRLSVDALLVESAMLTLHEAGQQAVAAEVTFRAPEGPFMGRFDWRHRGEERWSIEARTQAGTQVSLRGGGAELRIGGRLIVSRSNEYEGVYTEFARLIAARESRMDLEPLRVVADILLKGNRKIPFATEPASWRSVSQA